MIPFPTGKQGAHAGSSCTELGANCGHLHSALQEIPMNILSTVGVAPSHRVAEVIPKCLQG